MFVLIRSAFTRALIPQYESRCLTCLTSIALDEYEHDAVVPPACPSASKSSLRRKAALNGWRLVINRTLNIALRRTRSKHRILCGQVSHQRGAVNVEPLSRVLAAFKFDDSTDAPRTEEKLTVAFQPIQIFVGD